MGLFSSAVQVVQNRIWRWSCQGRLSFLDNS